MTIPYNHQSRIRTNLELRADVLAAVRNFFSNQGFLEVETPVRIPAPAPEAHIDAQASGSWFLQTSPELCMKRLLCSGYTKIYQICKCFRAKERGGRHLPEMTLLEWYAAHTDYTTMMDQTCELILSVAEKTKKDGKIHYQGNAIDLSGQWDRMPVSDAFDRYGSISMDKALETDRFDEVMGFEIEPRLGKTKPLFLYDYPLACGALARKKRDDPALVERFELYMAGVELCNAFSELTDPKEQAKRFEMEMAVRIQQGKSPYPEAEPFLKDLCHMPPASGNALGMDRLVMLFADTDQIDEVVAFTPEAL